MTYEELQNLVELFKLSILDNEWDTEGWVSVISEDYEDYFGDDDGKLYLYKKDAMVGTSIIRMELINSLIQLGGQLREMKFRAFLHLN
jgi:hypothetical protein